MSKNKDLTLPSQLLPAGHILLLPECRNKKRAFEQAALLLENISGLSRTDLFQEFMERERQGSTAIGYYGAIPHVHMADIKAPLCVLTRLKKPMQYDADNAPTSAVHTLIFLLAPEKEKKLHLYLLSVFAQLLADRDFMAALENCTDADAIHSEISAWETRHRDVLTHIWQDD